MPKRAGSELIVQRRVSTTADGQASTGLLRTDPSERARLRRWCGMLAVAATFFAVINAVAAALFGDPASVLIAIDALAYAGLAIVARPIAARGHEQRAVVLLVVGVLAVCLTMTISYPDLPSTSILMTVLAGVIALLFADRRTLPRLLALTWAVGLVATFEALLPAAPVVRPAAFEALMRVSSVAAAMALILWLLWQSRVRAQALLSNVLRHEHRIQSMVDSAHEAIIVVGGDGAIRSWNPRAEEIFGWSAGEAIGVDFGDLVPRAHERDSYERTFREAMTEPESAERRHLRREEMARHQDGHDVPIEINMSRFDSDGEILLSLFMRDLTEQRATEAHLDREIRERSAVASSVTRIRPGTTAEQTAASICRNIAESLNLDVTAIYHLISSNQAIPLGLRVPRGSPVSKNRPLPPGRAAYLIRRAKSGPWIERWEARLEDGAYGLTWAEVGLREVAYVPFRGPDGLLGLVIAATTSTTAGPDHMARRLSSLVEFAALAGALLGPQLAGRRNRQARSDLIRKVIDRGAFHAVFQPVVAIDTGAVVGYEALTRFDDLERPDIRIAEADTVGLGLELEITTMAAALVAARQLPEGPWISLNASPQMVLNGDCMRKMLHDVPRTVIVEITEQSPIVDYAAVRLAVASIGDNVRLAVDDAGAGFASLRHIIELRPNVVKLDVGLIRGIHADSARQALVAGMVHFAQRAGCDLIAEGIEEEADLQSLRGLGVHLGQGFLLGRPVPPSSLPERAPSVVQPAAPRDIFRWPPLAPAETNGVPLKN